MHVWFTGNTSHPLKVNKSCLSMGLLEGKTSPFLKLWFMPDISMPSRMSYTLLNNVQRHQQLNICTSPLCTSHKNSCMLITSREHKNCSKNYEWVATQNNYLLTCSNCFFKGWIPTRWRHFKWRSMHSYHTTSLL